MNCKNETIFRKPNPVSNINNINNNKNKATEISTATKRTSTVFGMLYTNSLN